MRAQMQKKKLDLTSSLIVVEGEPFKANESHTKAPLENKQQKNDTYEKEIDVKRVSLHIALTQEQKSEFKVWCVQRNINMNDAFIEAFELLKKIGLKNR
jgi:hypothetical protein